MDIDKKDRLILEALQADARQSLAALGKRIGLSQPAMSERVRKLEDAGVIEGYGARVNLRALGVGLQAIIRIDTTHAGIARYLKLFEQMPEVLSADRVTGEDCFIVRCAIAEPADLERGGRARGRRRGHHLAGAVESREQARHRARGEAAEKVARRLSAASCPSGSAPRCARARPASRRRSTGAARRSCRHWPAHWRRPS